MPKKVIVPNQEFNKSDVILDASDIIFPEGYKQYWLNNSQWTLIDSHGRINISHMYNWAKTQDPNIADRSPNRWLRNKSTKELRANYQNLLGFDPVNTVNGGQRVSDNSQSWNSSSENLAGNNDQTPYMASGHLVSDNYQNLLGFDPVNTVQGGDRVVRNNQSANSRFGQRASDNSQSENSRSENLAGNNDQTPYMASGHLVSDNYQNLLGFDPVNTVKGGDRVVRNDQSWNSSSGQRASKDYQSGNFRFDNLAGNNLQSGNSHSGQRVSSKYQTPNSEFENLASSNDQSWNSSFGQRVSDNSQRGNSHSDNREIFQSPN